jgi:hypothetical protein
MGREAMNIGGNLSGIPAPPKNRRYCMVDQRFLKSETTSISVLLTLLTSRLPEIRHY